MKIPRIACVITLLGFGLSTMTALLLTGCVSLPDEDRKNQATKLSALEILPLETLDVKPEVTFQGRPRHPVRMRRAGIAGAALVEFIVDDQGKVRDARTIRAAHEDFGEAAMAAIMTWKFNPGFKNGRAVATRMQKIIRFELIEN